MKTVVVRHETTPDRAEENRVIDDRRVNGRTTSAPAPDDASFATPTGLVAQQVLCQRLE